MTTLQEAAMRKALEKGKQYAKCLMMNQAPFDEALAALAQQGEQQPVCHGCGIPAGDVHMSTCKSGKWPSRVSNGDTAAPAPQAQEPIAKLFGTLPVYDTPAPQQVAQQGEPVAWAIYDKRGGSKSIHWAEQHTDGNAEMYNAIPLYKAASAPQPAQEPVKFLVNGTRFKLSFDTRGRVSSLWNFMDKLDGRWVALVAAENDCHLQSTALSVTAAGEREAGFTTGHCKEHAKPGGCQLHNLQCGYPACDRRAV